MHRKIYYFKTLQKIFSGSGWNFESLFHAFGQFWFKKDWKFCSLQFSEEQNYKKHVKVHMSSNAAWLFWKSIANPDLIKTPKMTHSKIHQMLYSSNTHHKYSLVVVRLEAYFIHQINSDSKVDCNFCSLQFWEEQNYKYMIKFMWALMVPAHWPIKTWFRPKS